MKTDSADTQDREADQADKSEEMAGKSAAPLHMSVAELQAYTYKNGDASFLCSSVPAPKAD